MGICTAVIVFVCFRAPEHIYEDISGDSHMGTMDVRIKVTADIMKDRDTFSEPGKPDGDFQPYESNNKTRSVLKANSDILSKAKGFKKKCLARISSL